MPITSRITPVAAAVLTAAAIAAPPSARAAGFSSRVDNPWYPLAAGSVYAYTGAKDGRPARETLRVTHRVKRIEGAPCIVVDDRLYQRGRLAEKTLDWYTQDARGNVWYFGERTATYDASGRVRSREGSFQAGVDGARAGIFMPAHPRVGASYEQEHYPGHALDRFRITAFGARVSVPFATTRRAMRTTETTPLEPGVVDAKYYVRGVGTVKEAQVRGAGPKEHLELVTFVRG
jgi:hypothetical protein